MAAPAIKTSGLTKLYRSNCALDGLDLEVEPEEIFGLLGHNGAGKTTTVSILTTLLEPTSGEASVFGKSVIRDAREVQALIGYLPENVEFYDRLTLGENLAYFGQLSGLDHPAKRIDEVLEMLDFTEHQGQRLGTFSKGMRQRVGIAQAILHRPQVLFLDEPNSGLDPQGVVALRELIMRLHAETGVTVFMNTHLLSEVTKVCSSIGILRAGKLIYRRSLAETMAEFAGDMSLEDIYLDIDKAHA